MKKTITAVVILAATYVAAQTCLVTRPSVPPKAVSVEVKFTNPDGGARPCFAYAITVGGQAPQAHQMSNAACDTIKPRADQAAANDNGWDDGGTP